MYLFKKIALTALSAALFAPQGFIQAAEYVDTLDTPAFMSQLAIKSPLNAIVHAGDRLVAVGIRGHVLYSDDAGKTWQQAKVPVSSDLTAVYFPTATDGWAVGHDGVVLHSSDAGVTWTKQLDGTQTGKLMLDAYTALAATDPANEQFAALVADAQRMVDEGADKPLLDVWFADNQNGYVVGAFGMIFRTADGGTTWTPQNEKVANPNGLHLNAIAGNGSDLTLVSEQGLVLRLDPASGNFVAVATPYDGSYFGVLQAGNSLVIHGLRGMAFRSNDGGASWTKLEVPVEQALTAATINTTGQLSLFSLPGDVLSSVDGGVKYLPQPQTSKSPISDAVAANDNTLVLVGSRGLRVLAIE